MPADSSSPGCLSPLHVAFRGKRSGNVSRRSDLHRPPNTGQAGTNQSLPTLPACRDGGRSDRHEFCPFNNVRRSAPADHLRRNPRWVEPPCPLASAIRLQPVRAFSTGSAMCSRNLRAVPSPPAPVTPADRLPSRDAPARRAWRRVPPPPSFVPPRSTPWRCAAAACRGRRGILVRRRDAAALRPAGPRSLSAFRTMPWNKRQETWSRRKAAPAPRGLASSGESSRRNFAISASSRLRPVVRMQIDGSPANGKVAAAHYLAIYPTHGR